MEIVFLAVLGLVIGSFLNVLIDRLPLEENVISGRSHCDHCKRILSYSSLIPVISFLMQRGKSRCCHKPLSWQYPLIESMTALLFVGVYVSDPYSSLTVYAPLLVLLCCLLVVTVADLKYQIIPDSMIVIGIVATILFHMQLMDSRLFITRYVLAGVGNSLFFLLLFLITKGRGMGFGDVKLALLLGIILGYPSVLTAMYVSFLTGAVVGVILILGKKKTMKSAVPFGPFMILGSMIAYLFF